MKTLHEMVYGKTAEDNTMTQAEIEIDLFLETAYRPQFNMCQVLDLPKISYAIGATKSTKVAT